MRLLSTLVWKSWASSPLRLLLTWLGVCLGVAIVAGIHVLDHNTILSQLERRRSDYGKVDFELLPRSDEGRVEAKVEDLRGRPGVAAVGVLSRASIVLVGPDGREVQCLLFGLDPLSPRPFGHFEVAEGELPSAYGGEERLLLAPALADLLGVGTGARLLAEAGPLPALADCVDGVLRPVAEPAPERPRAAVTVAGVLADLRLARQHGGRVAVGSLALARRLGRNAPPVLQVARAEGADPDRLEAGFRADYVLDTGRSALIGEGADERAFRNGVRVLGCLALVLGMFVIFHTLSHGLAERMRRIGTLRALGATQGQVVALHLCDALAVAVAGALAGIAGGILLAKLLIAAGLTTLGFGKSVTTFELPWTQLLAIAGLGVGFTLLGAAFPLWRIRALSPTRVLYVRDLAPPTDLMRGVHLFLLLVLVLALPLAYLALTPLLSGSGQGAASVLLQVVGLIAAVFAVLLLTPRLVPGIGGLPLRLLRPVAPLAAFYVAKELRRSPGRIATSVCGLTLVALSWVGLRSITGALQGEIRSFGREALAGRCFVRADVGSPPSAAELRDLRSLPGVAAVLPLVPLQGPSFLLLGTDPEALGVPGASLEGRPLLRERFRTGRTLVLSRRLARLRGLGVGDRVALPSGRRLLDYEVIAVSDRDGFFPDERAWALLSLDRLHADFCVPIDRIRDFVVRLSDPDGVDVGGALAARGIATSWVRSGRVIERFHLDDVDRDFTFFEVLLGLLLVLAGLAQLNLISLFTIAREREIGVLRALGMSRGGFAVVLLVEALVLAFLCGVLTIVVGLPLSWLLTRGLAAVSGLDVPWVPPGQSLVPIVLLCTAVSLLATLVPAFRATGLPPARAVRATE